MIPILLIAAACILFVAAVWAPAGKKPVLPWVFLAWTVAWAIVATQQNDLWPVALLGFLQNVAFTFVSRGRNSGSLFYHFIAAIFSNGLYAVLLFTAIDQVSQAKASPANFLLVYTLATLSGSIFAHWLALRMEKGKGKQVHQASLDNSLDNLRRRVRALETNGSCCEPVPAVSSNGSFTEGYAEITIDDGTRIRFWLPDEDSDVQALMNRLAQDARNSVDESSADLAERLCNDARANACQVTRGAAHTQVGAVHYRVWP